jgi:hypothetical protein
VICCNAGPKNPHRRFADAQTAYRLTYGNQAKKAPDHSGAAYVGSKRNLLLLCRLLGHLLSRFQRFVVVISFGRHVHLSVVLRTVVRPGTSL